MKYFIIILTILIVGCTANKQSVNKKQNEAKFIDVIIVDNNEQINFTIENNSEKSISILQAEKLHIEKLIDGEWNKIRVLSCPCDAPCARPIEVVELPSEEKYVMNWNKMESWCGKETEFGIRETKQKKIEEGKFRLRVTYNTKEDNNVKVIYKEFQI